MIRAVIFDCFGVIITDALKPLTAELNERDPDAKERVVRLMNLANSGVMSSADLTDQLSAELGLASGTYLQKIAEGEVKNQELLDYVVSLRGKCKTALLSNIPKGSLAKRFTDDEFKRYFDISIASGEIGYVKPEARAYEIAAEQLDVRLDECVFTDDHEIYVEGARAVGMHAILYRELDQFKRELEALLANA